MENNRRTSFLPKRDQKASRIDRNSISRDPQYTSFLSRASNSISGVVKSIWNTYTNSPQDPPDHTESQSFPPEFLDIESGEQKETPQKRESDATTVAEVNTNSPNNLQNENSKALLTPCHKIDKEELERNRKPQMPLRYKFGTNSTSSNPLIHHKPSWNLPRNSSNDLTRTLRKGEVYPRKHEQEKLANDNFLTSHKIEKPKNHDIGASSYQSSNHRQTESKSRPENYLLISHDKKVKPETFQVSHEETVSITQNTFSNTRMAPKITNTVQTIDSISLSSQARNENPFKRPVSIDLIHDLFKSSQGSQGNESVQTAKFNSPKTETENETEPIEEKLEAPLETINQHFRDQSIMNYKKSEEEMDLMDIDEENDESPSFRDSSYPASNRWNPSQVSNSQLNHDQYPLTGYNQHDYFSTNLRSGDFRHMNMEFPNSSSPFNSSSYIQPLGTSFSPSQAFNTTEQNRVSPQQNDSGYSHNPNMSNSARESSIVPHSPSTDEKPPSFGKLSSQDSNPFVVPPQGNSSLVDTSGK